MDRDELYSSQEEGSPNIEADGQDEEESEERDDNQDDEIVQANQIEEDRVFRQEELDQELEDGSGAVPKHRINGG